MGSDFDMSTFTAVQNYNFIIDPDSKDDRFPRRILPLNDTNCQNGVHRTPYRLILLQLQQRGNIKKSYNYQRTNWYRRKDQDMNEERRGPRDNGIFLL